MKRFALTMSLAACLVFALGAVAMAFPDSVFVESKSVATGGTVNVGIFMSNSAAITALVMPLKIVAGTPAANIDSVRINTPAGTRYSGKLIAVEIYQGYLAQDGDPYPVGCGNGFKNISWEDTVGNHDPFLTHATPGGVPVGILITRLTFGAGLAAGTDAPTKPSFTLDIRVAASCPGQFVVDTSCVDPSSYLSYVDANGEPVLPVFTKGIITVGTPGAPPVARDTSWSTNQDTPNPVTHLPASDPTGDVLTFSMLISPLHGVISGFNAATGAFTYTPAAGYSGADSLKFKVCDPCAMCDTGTVRITVSAVNHTPVARDTTWSTGEDTAKVVTYLPASDVDVGQTLTFSITAGPSHGGTSGFNPGTGAFTYTPTANYCGADSLTFQVCDNAIPSLCTTAKVRITVNCVNDAPVARDTSWSTGEDTAKSVAFLPWSHVDVGQTLTFSITAGPSHGVISALVVGTGAFTYTPAANYCGADSLTFQVCDNGVPVLCTTAKVRITVNCVNDAPVARDTSWSTGEDTAKSVAFLPWSHVDVGQTLTFSITAGPSHGVISALVVGTGAFTYTPAANYCGADSLTFQVCDNGVPVLCTTAKVRITVNCVNDAPVAVNDAYNATEGVTLNVPAPGVLANDSDPDADPMTAVLMGSTAHGALTLYANGSFDYMPNANYNGPDTFTYKASDGALLSNVATVSITVRAVNHPPVAVADAYGTDEDSALHVAVPGVLTNDSDPDADPITAVLMGSTTHGSLTLNANGSFDYTPNANYNGPDTFTYKASDGLLQSNVATVAITVNPVNDPPVLNAIGPKSVDEGVNLHFTVTATDVDNAVTLSADSLPPTATFTSGEFDWTPGCAQSGVYHVTFIASDGLLADSEIVTITVNDRPDILVSDVDSVTITYGQGDPLPPPVVIHLSDTGCGQISWGAISSATWLIATPNSGTTPSTVDVTIDPTGLTQGPYSATLTIGPVKAGKVATTINIQITVHLNIVPPTSPHDSVWVSSSVPGAIGDTVAVDVNFSNNHEATGISVGLKYSPAVAHIIGASFAGSRVASINDTIATINSLDQTICLAVIPIPPGPRIPVGSGKLATLYFVVDSAIGCPTPVGAIIDSFTVGVGCELMVTDTNLAAAYVSFVPGAVNVQCPVSICGTVTDTGGIALGSACVQVWSSYPDGVILGADTTDVDGGFCVGGLNPHGKYDLRIYRAEYCSQILQDVLPTGASPITVMLEPAPTVPTMPLVADYWSVNAKIQGVPLMIGDVITAVDPNGVVCGRTTVIAPGEYLIHVMGDDPVTLDVDEGARTSDVITFYLNCTCPLVVPTPWSAMTSTPFDADFNCAQRQQQVTLCDVWSLISFSVLPSDPSRAAVLSSIDGEYQHVFTATCADGPLSWEASRPINDLNTMDPFHGYWIKANQAGVGPATITGAAMAVSTPMDLCPGWNLVSYLPDVPDTIFHALSSIDTKYSQVFGFECSGGFASLDGNRPAFLNDLNCMKPGRGYWIKMNTSATLTYPAGGYTCNQPITLSKPVNLLDRVTVTPRVADFWSVADLNTTGLHRGDHITARTQSGVICGECVVGPQGAFLLHVYGDDPTTAGVVEGAIDGEALRFDVNDALAKIQAGSPTWMERQSNQLTVTTASANPVPTAFALLQNYPNPFNPSTVIEFRLPVRADVTLTIYNVLGQTVRVLFSGSLDEGQHTYEWDGRNRDGATVQSGIYFYRLQTATWSDVRKMTLLK